VTFIFVRRRYSESLGAAQATDKVATGLALGSLTVTALAGLVPESPIKYAVGCVMGVTVGFGITKFMGFAATPEGQVWIDTKKLQLPVFGPLFRMLAVARFARTLSTLLKSGVPLLKAMDIVKNVLDNAKLERVVKDLSASVREGESIAAPLKKSGDFPPLVTHMIAVGEKSGQLEQMLETVAKNYDTQVDTRVQALTSLLEPMMIVLMGGSVGFIAFAILMPLIQMNDFGP
jgi:general secretion pathway protein F